MPAPEAPGTNVRHYLTILRRRKWIVIVTAFIAVGSTVAFSALQTPVYESHSRVLIRQSQSLFENGFNFIDPASIETEIELFSGEGVQSLVRERLGSTPPISASVVGTTAVIDVAARSNSPRTAAQTSTAYAEAYVDYRRQEAIESLVVATKELEQEISGLEQQIADSQAKDAANKPSPPGVPPTASAETIALQAQRDAFKQKLDQASVDTAIKKGGATLVSRAAVPTASINPGTVRNVMLGLFAGLIVGIGIAFLVEQFDDSLKTKEDLEGQLTDIPVLGLIPRLNGWRNRDRPQLVSRSEPSSPTAEAYRTLRTSVQFLGEERKVRSILVTSPSAGDGKTTTLANLAVALARSGQRVVIVSCDLRRPRIHEFFEISNDVGFTSVLLDNAPLSSALQEVAEAPGIRVLPSGALPLYPAELLSSRRTGDVLTAIESQCDVILVDCPPVLPVTDAAVLSARVDGVLLVALAGTTTKKQLSRTVESLRQVDAALLGVVLNGVTGADEYGYQYGYYRQDDRKVKAVRRLAKKASRQQGRRRESAPKGGASV